MEARTPAAFVSLVLIMLLAMSGTPVMGETITESPHFEDSRDGKNIHEIDDQTHTFGDALALTTGDVYYGHLNRVGDREDYFSVVAAQNEVVNVHVYVMGHDGTTEWVRPTVTDPPSPPSQITASTSFNCFIYHRAGSDYPVDGAYNYYYVRDYVVNICAPMPGTNTYYVNVSMSWPWTPNNYTWDYMLELDISQVPEITPGVPVSGTIDLATRDTLWYKVEAQAETEVNGSFEILNFDTTDPEDRNVDIWIFPDDLGGYPRSVAWDWSAATNEQIEPFSILATYDGWFYIKLRGMNHISNLPCSYRLQVQSSSVPEFPSTGIQNSYFDRETHDTDWYRFEMRANQPHATKPGLWNEVRYFNMTERADAEDLPDFDLYLFGLAPGGRALDLLDSSYRNDHPTFLDPNRDPNKNTEHVKAAAFYNGSYFIEVNAYNNTGYYDLRTEELTWALSDNNNLPETADPIYGGTHGGFIHQAEDHYDWYAVIATKWVRLQFDSFKVFDMFNLSIYSFDEVNDEYRLIGSGWNVNFNLSSREDEITNAIDIDINLVDLGLGAGTYYVSVFAAVATGIGADVDTGRTFIYVTDGEAKAHYELRVWTDIDVDGVDLNPIPQTEVAEDTNLVDHIDLYDHFVPKDKDEVLRFRARVDVGRVSEIILTDTHLGFRAASDFVGDVVIKITAFDRSNQMYSLRWFVEFTPENDAPRLMVTDLPFVFEMSEDSSRVLDLGKLVSDPDKDDTTSASISGAENVRIEVDPETLSASIEGAPNWYGTEQVTFKFTDTVGAFVELPVEFRVANVDDSPIAVSSLDAVMMDEDTTFQIDISRHVIDVDGDVLDVFLSADAHIGSSYDPATMTLTLEPVKDWYGFKYLWVTVQDPAGHRVMLEFGVEVKNVPDPPNAVAWSPGDFKINIDEGKEVTFVVLNVTDPDSPYLVYNWFLDGEFVGPSVAWTFHPGLLDQGAHLVSVEIVDEGGLKDTISWDVLVIDIPRPLEGGIATPEDLSSFSVGDQISFLAFYHDPDGEEISYTWYLDGDSISSAAMFDRVLPEGDHTITLVVSSGDDTISEELDISIVKDNESFPIAVVLTLVLVGLGTLFTTFFIRRSGQKI